MHGQKQSPSTHSGLFKYPFVLHLLRECFILLHPLTRGIGGAILSGCFVNGNLMLCFPYYSHPALRHALNGMTIRDFAVLK